MFNNNEVRNRHSNIATLQMWYIWHNTSLISSFVANDPAKEEVWNTKYVTVNNKTIYYDICLRLYAVIYRIEQENYI